MISLRGHRRHADGVDLQSRGYGLSGGALATAEDIETRQVRLGDNALFIDRPTRSYAGQAVIFGVLGLTGLLVSAVCVMLGLW